MSNPEAVALETDLRSEERGTVEEHRAAHKWMREKFANEREMLLQIHSVLVDLLEEARGKKK